MGEEQGFWRHWWRGARAFVRFGAAMAAAALGTAALGLLAIGGYEWLARQLHLPHFDPNVFAVVGVAAAGIVLFAPNVLSTGDDKKRIFPAWRAGPPTSMPRDVAIEVADGFRFLDGVLCQDVRVERGGSWILLGTYGWAIVVPGFPHQVTVSGLLNVETTKAFVEPLFARFRLDERVVSLTRITTKGEIGSWTITLIPRVIDVEDPATLHIEIGIDGEVWTEVMRKPVIGVPDEDG